jgi:hypothetical protein
MAIRQAQQEYEGSAGVNELARRGERDPYAYLQHGKQGQAAAASITKIQKEKLESDEKRNIMLGGLAGPAISDPTPATFDRQLTRAVNYGLMTEAQKQEVIAQYGGSPESIRKYSSDIATGSINAQAQQANTTSIENNKRTVGATIRGQDLTNARAMEGTWSNVIVGRRVMQHNSRTGEYREVQDPTPDVGGTVTVGPITNLPDTSTGGGVVTGGGGTPAAPNTLAAPSVNALRNPPVVATAPVSRARQPVTNPLMVEEKPVWNEKAGVYMYPPTAENPQGKVVEAPAVQEAVQKRAATQTLKVAGFNPKTGTDEISELIKKSTSGLGENWTSKAWGAVTGAGTSGAKAIAALETRANQLTLDLAPNGSLGAGFSNDDRNFMLAKLGDVSNPNAPMNVRLAAWEDVMERAARTAGVPYPKSAKNTGDITVDPALAEALKKYPVKK